MKKLLSVLGFLLLVSVSVFAQTTTSTARRVAWSASVPASCIGNSVLWVAGIHYTCNAATSTATGTYVANGSSSIANQSVLGATFSLTTTSTYQDTGLSVSLPSAGTYLLTANVRGSIQISLNNGFISAKLYNSTAAADVPNAVSLLIFTDNTSTSIVTGTITVPITVAGATTIKLYAKRDGSATWVNSAIPSDANGLTTLTYLRLS